MAIEQVTDWLRRFHYRVDPQAQIVDCFKVEVLDLCLYAGTNYRPNVELKQLWAEALHIAGFLQTGFAQRDWRRFGLKGPNDLRPFAVITGCQEERERVKHGIKLDVLCYECMALRDPETPADHERRVRHLVDLADALEWLEMN